MSSAIVKRPGAASLLYGVLEAPEHLAALQRLDPPVLARLIHHVGLEDASELVTLATPAQLERIFDDDLWRRAKPGKEERFDPERFGLWLEVMLEMGAERAAQKLAELDEDLVTLGLSHQVLVFDLDALTEGRLRSHDDDADALVDKALESSLCHELDGYLLISRSPESWDALLSVLVALDEQHHDLLAGMLDRICHLSSEYVEDHGGLYEVLTATEQLESDVAAAREDRLAAEGFISPSDAAAFLGLARMGRVGDDVITRSYFRSLTGREERKPNEMPASLGRLLQEMEEVEPAAALPLLGSGEGPDPGTALVREALASITADDLPALEQHLQALAMLANMLRAGCTHRGRSLRPLEAAQVAVATCNLGIELRMRDGERAVAVVQREGLVPLFGEGWKLLHDELVIPTAKSLVKLLAGHRTVIATQVRITLERDLADGKPWRSRGRLRDVAPLLSRREFELARDLLDECPATEGKFFGTLAQVQQFSGR